MHAPIYAVDAATVRREVQAIAEAEFVMNDENVAAADRQIARDIARRLKAHCAHYARETRVKWAEDELAKIEG